MTLNIWNDINEPPMKNGLYMVRFYFQYNHPCERDAIAVREFKDGVWIKQYYSHENEDSKLVAWCELE